MKKQLFQIMLAGSFAAGLLTVSSPGWADDTMHLQEQVQTLQNRVNQLESQLANKQQVPMAATMPVYDQWEDPYIPYYLLGGPNFPMKLMQEQMDRNMRQAFAETGAFIPRTDIKQTDRQYLITMDIPGMDKNKISVETKDGMLIISGERKSETEDKKNNQYYRHERSFGSFLQEVPLPEDAQADQIDAKYNNGVLTVTVGRVKKEEKKPENTKIMVK